MAIQFIAKLQSRKILKVWELHRLDLDLPWYSVMGMDKSLMGTRLLPGIVSNVGPKYT